MSLTSQIRTGDLAWWCEYVFTDTPAAVDQVVHAVQGIRPVRPIGKVASTTHWADVGGAFGQRLADLIEPAPPYGALLGMVRAGWMSWEQAHAQAAAYPTHAGLAGPHRARALSMRRTPDGWLDLGPTPTRPATNPAAEAAFVELLERTRTYQAQHAEVGTFAGPGAEAGLARSAWVISACEGIYRSGHIDSRLDAVLRAGASADQLRALVADPVVSELGQLVDRARDVLPGRARRIAGNPSPGQPLGVAAPTIVPHWADGDILIGDAHKTTLIDVKTVISVADPARVAQWLWQILLYAWLDTTDLHHIRDVGLYLARHGVLLTWEVAEHAELLLGSSDLYESARDNFHDIAEEVTAAEGASFPLPSLAINSDSNFDRTTAIRPDIKL